MKGISGIEAEMTLSVINQSWIHEERTLQVCKSVLFSKCSMAEYGGESLSNDQLYRIYADTAVDVHDQCDT